MQIKEFLQNLNFDQKVTSLNKAFEPVVEHLRNNPNLIENAQRNLESISSLTQGHARPLISQSFIQMVEMNKELAEQTNVLRESLKYSQDREKKADDLRIAAEEKTRIVQRNALVLNVAIAFGSATVGAVVGVFLTKWVA